MELNVYKQEDASIDLSMISCYVDALESHCMDPVDYFLSDNFDNSKTIYISNDTDFQTLSKIQVLTA